MGFIIQRKEAYLNTFLGIKGGMALRLCCLAAPEGKKLFASISCCPHAIFYPAKSLGQLILKE
ncbi:hypothetical protein PARA125_001439 [Parachlamydia sp. AcF125]|nr:hypothetical protein [Parachlamydia sp. AcF125]